MSLPQKRMLERARSLLDRPGAWLDQSGGAYPLRLGGDRRGRVVLTLDEAAFRALIERPGLRRRDGGGWLPRPTPAANTSLSPSPPPGRPGLIEGERAVMEPDGRLTTRRATLGESPVAWLARRKDASGRPWLSAAEAQGVGGPRLIQPGSGPVQQRPRALQHTLLGQAHRATPRARARSMAGSSATARRLASSPSITRS